MFYIFFSSDEPHTENVKRVLREYHNRITALEDKKFDIEYVVKKKDFEVFLSKKETQNCGECNYVNNYAKIIIYDTVTDVIALDGNASIFVPIAYLR